MNEWRTVASVELVGNLRFFVLRNAEDVALRVGCKNQDGGTTQLPNGVTMPKEIVLDVVAALTEAIEDDG